MNKKMRALRFIRELSFIDNETLELKKEVQLKSCPFCEIDDGEIFSNFQTINALFYEFKKCRRCSLIYPYPRPNKSVLEEFFIKDLENRGIFKNYETEQLKIKNGFSLKGVIKNAIGLRNYNYEEFKDNVKKNDKVLEVGIGHGIVARHLIEKGCIVEGVEINPYRAEDLSKRLNIKIYKCSFVDAPLQKDYYDVVVFSQVLMHLFSLKEVFSKINYVLRPGGYFVSSQMNFNSVIQQTVRAPSPLGLNAFSICSWFTPESLKIITEKSGFEVKDIKYRYTGLFTHLFLDKYPPANDFYPGNFLVRLVFRIMDKIITKLLVKTGTSDYFSIITKKNKK